MSLSQKALEVAEGQLGREEIPRGSNWGPDIQKYLAAVGIKTPAPWCMAFVFWCTAEAAREVGQKNPLYMTGRVMDQWYKVPAAMRVHQPQAGDIFVMEFAHGLGHTGFIESVDGNVVHTIEGNTNEDGSREGYEVAKRARNVSSFIGFIRLT